MKLTSHQVRNLIRNQIEIISEQSSSQQIPDDVMKMITAGLEDISSRYTPGSQNAKRVVDLILSLNLSDAFDEREEVELLYQRIFPEIVRLASSIPIRPIRDPDRKPAFVIGVMGNHASWGHSAEDGSAEGLHINLSHPWESEDSFIDATREGVIDHEIRHVIRWSFFKNSGIDLPSSQWEDLHLVFDVNQPSPSASEEEILEYENIMEERRVEISRLRDWVTDNFNEFTSDVREAICIIKHGTYTENQEISSIIDLWNQDRPMEEVALRDLKCPLTSDITSTIDGIAKNQPAGTSDSDAVALAESVSMSSSIDNIRDIIRRNIIYSDRKNRQKISDNLMYHINRNAGVDKNIFRPGSDEFFSLFREVRSLSKSGLYSLNKAERELIEELDIGEFGVYEGELVPLDFPMLYDNQIDEAEYKGRKVKLNKPKRSKGGKAYVYVNSGKKNKDGTIRVKKVSFGSSMPDAMGDSDAARKRRKSFGNRHNCAKKNDKTKAGYWSCRATKHFGRNISGWW